MVLSSQPDNQPVTPGNVLTAAATLLPEARADARRLAYRAKVSARQAAAARVTASAQESRALLLRSRELQAEATSHYRQSRAVGPGSLPTLPPRTTAWVTDPFGLRPSA